MSEKQKKLIANRNCGYGSLRVNVVVAAIEG